MKYRADQQREDTDDEPTLADMTEKAIRILRRGNNGYFLLVEGNCVIVIDDAIRNRTMLQYAHCFILRCIFVH